jgi:GH25 family lysozyme M1 (1,4-beta-N-acetylmuramidase)
VDLTWGIDVSKWQETIDWPAVERSGRAAFAAVRVAVGLRPDERWQANLAGAADHCPLPMAYAVVGTRANQAEAADVFCNLVARVAPLDRVGLVVDAENFGDGSHPTQAQVHAFRDELRRLTGRWPFAYEPDWWLAGHGYRTDGASWPWWPSKYVKPPWTSARLAALRPGLEHGFAVQGPWQFTSSGSVAGVVGNVDRNVYFGTLAQLRALALGPAAAEEEEPDVLTDQQAATLGEIATGVGQLHTDMTTLLRGEAHASMEKMLAKLGSIDDRLGQLVAALTAGTGGQP